MNPPLVVIVGETASGKTALAIEIAQRFNGEIIAADSRTVYKGMDIGTAKPTREEQAGIAHFGLDVVSPGEQFSAYDFQKLANNEIEKIGRRGKLPIIVGGTGLYINSILYNYAFRSRPDSAVRNELQDLSVAELQARILAANLPLPANSHNPRHLMRVLESGESPHHPKDLRPNTLVLGLSLSTDILRQRITERVEHMVVNGLIDEVRNLIAAYGDTEALRAPGYKAVSSYLRGEISLAEAKRRFIRDDMRLAKRQRTWFRQNKDIHWLPSDNRTEAAVQLVNRFIHT